MKPSDFLSALLTFFNDFIGVAAPGFVFIICVVSLNTQANSEFQQISKLFGGDPWLVGIALSYTIGHVFLALYLGATKVLKGFFGTKGESPRSSACAAFEDMVSKRLKKLEAKEEPMTTSDLRSVAMSVSSEAGELGRRFMFISLFCNGVATSLCVVVLSSFLPETTDFGSSWSSRIVMFVVAALLFWRGSEFAKRALNTPFPIALSKVIFDACSGATDKKS